MLRYNHRLYIGVGSPIKEKVLKHVHESSLGGHSGITGTYQRAKAVFYWRGMRNNTLSYVQACDVCKMNKGDNAASPGLLQPLEIPDQAWSHISMDFVEGLPKSEGKDTILVIVDRFTTYGHF